MKKRLTSMLLAMVCVLSMAVPAVAAQAPKVYVDERAISFADQEPVILPEEGRTMVPARGVFEVMGLTVTWDETFRQVKVRSEDNMTQAVLVIDDPVMKVYHFKNLMDSDLEEITLDAPPQIMNDRTMVPLRAISESFKANVMWDEASVSVYITTANKPLVPAPDAVKVSMQASKTEVAKGDTFDVTIDVSGLPEFADGEGINALSAGVFYDAGKFKLVDGSVKVPAMGTNAMIASNEAFQGDSVKVAAMTADEASYIKQDGTLITMTFESLTGEAGEFVLSNRYSMGTGYDTSLVQTKGDKLSEIGRGLVVSTTPVAVNQ
jgi:hypothetical protein